MKFITTAIATIILAATGTLAAPPLASRGAPSTSGTCSGTDNRCVGDITYWSGGLGACGWDVNSNTENQIALPQAFMGTQSNGNPFCGKSVTIYNVSTNASFLLGSTSFRARAHEQLQPATGTTAQATVGDKCMGCNDRSIDLTFQLLGQLTNGNHDAGRVPDVQWFFN